MIRTYQAVPLGTPDVERNLGKLTELLREHSGANNGASFHMLLEGALELDEKEEDVFGRDVASTQVLLRFTETSRSWQRMWIQVHGRRFGGYQKGRTRAPPTKARPVSEAKIQQRRRSAATAMVKRDLAGNAHGDGKCFGGLLRKDLSGSALLHVIKKLPQTKEQRNFREHTALIQARRKTELLLRRASRGDAFCLPPTLKVTSAPTPKAPALPDRVQVVPMRTSISFQVKASAWVSVRPSLYSAVRVAHVIVVPDMMPFQKRDTWEDAILLIYAIGLGKIMIAEKDWHGDKPWAGPKAIRYKPQAKASTLILVANSHLQKHPNVMTALQACSEEGKWTLVTERPENPGSRTVHFLDELPTVRQFLFQQRRIFRHSQDASGKVQKV